MSRDPSRRFTDREVSLVLRRAAEIDEREGAGVVASGSGGLSLDDLREIAGEVGISAPAIERAVASLEQRASLGPAWAGAPLVRKAVRAVSGELDRDAMARLVQVVDETADQTGAISEALGSVRWTASDRLRSSLVTITPAGGETRIQVVEKALPRVRRLFHLLPAAWGVMIGAPFIGLAGSGTGTLAAVGVAALSLAAGAGAGRAAWTFVSARSARRVEAMAAALAREAAAASGVPAGPGQDRETE